MTTGRAVDAHAHVFCNGNFPLSPERLYTPHPCETGTAKQFAAVLDAHGFTHGLLVGAGPYRPDNSCMLSAIRASNGRFKGIALVKSDIAESDLSSLADQGVVGIRINLMGYGMKQLVEPGAAQLLAYLKEMNLFLQIHCQKNDLVEALPLLRKAGVRILIDHLGRPDPDLGLSQPGFAALLELGKSGNAAVKLSGPFRFSKAGYPYHDVDRFIAAAVEAFTLDNCVWGSDWPFVDMKERVDYGPPATCLKRWLPNLGDQKKLLWDTPARLFGFDQD